MFDKIKIPRVTLVLCFIAVFSGIGFSAGNHISEESSIEIVEIEEIDEVLIRRENRHKKNSFLKLV